MRFFWNMPIRTKLKLVIMITSTVALFLACAAFVTYEMISFRQDMQRQLSTHAQIIGSNCRAALLFEDQDAAAQTLSALRAEPHIVSAGIYTPRGILFASYVRPGVLYEHVSHLQSHAFPSDRHHLSLSEPIVHDNETIGTVYLRMDLDEMHQRLQRYAGIVVLVLIVSSLAALVLSAKLQRVVSAPIVALARIAREVSEKKDYSMRATSHYNDETGRLIRAFNEMLTQIQARDKALDESEQHFRSLIENASDIITILDRDCRIRYESPSSERVLGYEPEELIGKSVLDFVHGEDVLLVRENVLKLFESPQVSAPVVLRFRHKDGRWVILESIGRNLMEDRRVTGIVVNSRDVTERKQAEEKLQNYASQLERSNHELQDFAYVASHDLQEPLRKIQAFGDRLKVKCAEALGDQGRDYLERMQVAAGRMSTLITDLLQFSRVTTKAQPFVLVDLNKVAQEVISDLEVRIEQTKGCVDVEELVAIEADPLQMRQLLQNLLGNALKFHKKDTPSEVKIRAQLLNNVGPSPDHSRNNGPMCEITVQDNGIGFDEKYLDRIFTIFQRLHGRSEYEGTGIGLAICRKIVERHGGTITARSKPDQGATFIIHLPLTQNHGEEP